MDVHSNVPCVGCSLASHRTLGSIGDEPGQVINHGTRLATNKCHMKRGGNVKFGSWKEPILTRRKGEGTLSAISYLDTSYRGRIS